jgi:polyisoprenoid-binding protein YceI
MNKEHRMHRTLTAAAILALSSATLAGLAGWTAAGAESREIAAEISAAQRLYEVDIVHSSLIFKIRHAGMANFYGRFNTFTGQINFDEANPVNSTFNFTVQTGSVDTANNGRDGHLKNADFFNSRQFPTIEFKSTGMKQLSEGRYELTGDLTLMGETRPVTAVVTDVTTGKVRDNDAMGFEARFSIQRSDFGMTKYLAPDNGEGGALGNTVELIVAVEAVGK